MINQATQEMRLAQADYRCEWEYLSGTRCRNTHSDKYKLHLHHRTYEREGHERGEDLSIFCPRHHMVADLIRKFVDGSQRVDVIEEWYRDTMDKKWWWIAKSEVHKLTKHAPRLDDSAIHDIADKARSITESTMTTFGQRVWDEFWSLGAQIELGLHGIKPEYDLVDVALNMGGLMVDYGSLQRPLKSGAEYGISYRNVPGIARWRSESIEMSPTAESIKNPDTWIKAVDTDKWDFFSWFIASIYRCIDTPEIDWLYSYVSRVKILNEQVKQAEAELDAIKREIRSTINRNANA